MYEGEYRIDYNINSFVEGVGNLLKEVSVLLEVDEYDYDHLNSLIKK